MKDKSPFHKMLRENQEAKDRQNAIENRRTLSNTMNIGQKIGKFIEYLQGGGELVIEDVTWVWCNDLITREEMGDNGEMKYWGIDGLAIKTTVKNLGTGEEKPHYIGQQDIPLHGLIELVEKITEEDWLGIGAGIALKSLNKKRNV